MIDFTTCVGVVFTKLFSTFGNILHVDVMKFYNVCMVTQRRIKRIGVTGQNGVVRPHTPEMIIFLCILIDNIFKIYFVDISKASQATHNVFLTL